MGHECLVQIDLNIFVFENYENQVRIQMYRVACLNEEQQKFVYCIDMWW